jgi:hypothetical protein
VGRRREEKTGGWREKGKEKGNPEGREKKGAQR